jgi:hypothetical protein
LAFALQYHEKNKTMKKILLIAGLLLILGLAFSSQTGNKENKNVPDKEIVIEDELVVEDWMMEIWV